MKHHIRAFVGLAFVFMLAAAVPYLARAADAGDPQPNLIEALQSATDGELRISRHGETGLVRFLGVTPEAAIEQPALVTSSVTPDAAARSFFHDYGALFGITDAEQQLSLMAERALDDGRSVVRYQQTHEGIPVLAGELMVQMNSANAVLSVNGEVLPQIDLDVRPALSAQTARETALDYVAKAYELDAAQLESVEPALWIYSPRLMGGPGPDFSSLVWRLEVTSPQMLELREFVLVDAHLGAVALNFNQVHSAKNRMTYDAGNTDTLPGTLRRSEGQGPFGDADVDNAHDFAGDTYDFFLNEHGRDSLDDAGMTMISTTDYCSPGGSCPMQNAFWNGQQMAYGDGFASADDVVGHELAHGVTDFSSSLFYFHQSGAINESLSDVWGEFVDLTNGSGDDSPGVRWLLGEDLPPAIGAIRNMSNPPAFGDPDRIGSPNFYCGPNDTGGVHWNSGVNNKATYLMVDGDTFNGQTVTGIGISKVADLYYEVQTNMLTSGSNYADLYDALIQASIVLGYTPAERQAVQNALLAVEMNVEPCGREAPAPVCAPGQTPAYVFFDDLENPASGNWTTGTIQGANAWFYPQNPNGIIDATHTRSGDYNIWGYNYFSTSDSFIATTQSYALPADAYLHFYHDWQFESFLGSFVDGGVLEYSINAGASWQDAGALFSENGYNGAISNSFGNPLGGRDAFVDASYGYTASRLDLSSLAGEDVRIRFRIGTDASADDYGWFLDDIGIYSCQNLGVFDPDVLLPIFVR